MARKKKQIFKEWGPVHVKPVNWNNPDHRRSIAASLVQGVYVQERDRQKERRGSEAFAPPWWKSFDFKRIDTLEDKDSSIVAAIYQLDASNDHHSAHNAPKYVVAFRGTILRRKTLLKDAITNFEIVWGTLGENPRFGHALEKVRTLVDSVGGANIWLAGHSQGAATAMLVGREMAKTNFPIESYLFNPPLISAPIEWIKNPVWKFGIHYTISVIKSKLAIAVKGHPQIAEDDLALSRWTPNLFVNPNDRICSNYIGKFHFRRLMEVMGPEAATIERIAAHHPIRSLVLGLLGKDSKPMHRLPSACLTVNRGPSKKFRQSHGIAQWWSSNFKGQSTWYQFQ